MKAQYQQVYKEDGASVEFDKRDLEQLRDNPEVFIPRITELLKHYLPKAA